MIDRIRNAWGAANPIARVAVYVLVAVLTLGGAALAISGGSASAANAAPVAATAGSSPTAQPAASTPAGSSTSAAPSTLAQRAGAPAVDATQPSNDQPGPTGTTATTPAPTGTTEPPATEPEPEVTTPAPTTPPATTPAPVEWPQALGGKPGGCWRDPCAHVYGLYATNHYDSFPGCVGTGFWFHMNGVNVEACGSLMGGTWSGFTATAACHVEINPNSATGPTRVYDFPAGASVSFYFNVYDHDVSVGYGCGVFTNA